MAGWDPFADPADEEEIASAPKPAVAAPGRTAAAAPAKLSRQDFMNLLDNVSALDSWPAIEALLQPAKRMAEAKAVDEDDGKFFLQVSAARTYEECIKGVSIPRLKAYEELCSLFAAAQGADAPQSDSFQVKKPKASNGHVVLILGFGGSTLADMADCAKWHEAADSNALIITLIYSGSLAWQLPKVFETISELASAKEASSIKLVVHLFSNLGMMCWRDLLKSWPQDGSSTPVPAVKDILQGIILDSSPDGKLPKENCANSCMGITAAMISMGSSMNGKGEPRSQEEKAQMPRQIAKMLTEGSLLWRKYQEMSDSEFDMCRIDTNVVKALEPPTSMLFLYSPEDKIIPSSGVERYYNEVLQRSDRSSKLTIKHSFPISVHCRHKDIHKKEYWSKIESFLQDIGVLTK